jgi:hypothetical protein
MPITEKSFAFIEKKDTGLKEDDRRTSHVKYEDFMYVAWGLTLVAVSVATVGEFSHPVRLVSAIAAGFFFIVGCFSWFLSFRSKKRKLT